MHSIPNAGYISRKKKGFLLQSLEQTVHSILLSSLAKLSRRGSAERGKFFIPIEVFPDD